MKREADAHLAAMTQELRTLINELNILHHPVYPGDPERIRILENEVTELKEAIMRRRGALAKQQPAITTA